MLEQFFLTLGPQGNDKHSSTSEQNKYSELAFVCKVNSAMAIYSDINKAGSRSVQDMQIVVQFTKQCFILTQSHKVWFSTSVKTDWLK